MRDRFDWARLRAFVTGLVKQELWLRNEYLITENRLLRAPGRLGCGCQIRSELCWPRSRNGWDAKR